LPNILIIRVDDMGYGYPRCFKPKSKIAKPHIDRLAAEGMRFTDAHAGGSICVPSRYTLLRGRMPYRNWNTASAKRTKKGDLSALEKKHFPQPQLHHEPDRLNLATLMKRQCYATACVGNWC
jgi:arylsulfatase A